MFKKVVDQASSWRRQGVEAGIFVATSPSSAPDWEAQPEVQLVQTFGNGLQSLSVQRDLINAVHAWRPDVTYVRTTPRHASVQRLLRRLHHVIEIQTNDLVESKRRSIAHYALAVASRRACLQTASGLVFVSRELSRHSSFSRFTKARTVIGNGIDLNRFDILPAPSNLSPRLAFMGSPSIPWQGLEDILSLARIRPSWNFDLIGPRPAPGATPPNVTAHGELRDSLYRPILARADVGISTLAWHRNKMNEASPLKSREYFALGLPVIGAYEDTDISGGSGVYLRLENRPLAIVDAVLEVEAFIKRWQGHRVQHEQVCSLDSGVKEQQRLVFLQSTL